MAVFNHETHHRGIIELIEFEKNDFQARYFWRLQNERKQI
jgi:pantothenate kinase-related protein Tda10